MFLIYKIYEHVSSAKNQTEYVSVMGTKEGSFKIFKNGTELLNGFSTEENLINLDSPQEEYTEVGLSYDYDPVSPLTKIIGTNNYSPNAVFKKYGQDRKLKNNTTFNISISLNSSPIEWSFSSKYSPSYATVQSVRNDCGDILSGVTDYQIALCIYKNSKEADENIEANEIEVTSGIPSSIKKWVRYKTDLDLINAVYLSLCGSSGTVNRELGIIKVQKVVELPVLKTMMEYFKEKLDVYDSSISPTTSTPSSFSRAGNIAYPLTGRNSF